MASPDEIAALRATLMDALARAHDEAGLQEARIHAIGRKSKLIGLMRDLRSQPPEKRRELGESLNRLRADLEAGFAHRREEIAQASMRARVDTETLDVTLPARRHATGTIHPISHTIDELIAIFAEMGFSCAEGPDIEDDFHNFAALNFPPDHPARQEHDTFYLPPLEAGGAPMVLRTHTSPVQIRTMMEGTPPFRIIAPGRTFRADHDATHSPNFHQLEGLVIDEAIHMGHLRGCLVDFCRAFFEIEDLAVRFRPSFFPFTEPSAEVDIGCSRKDGSLLLGGTEDWLEILGCGMVHPNVLRNCGLDPDLHQGFAFGMGVERVAMLKYGIPDLRALYECDPRWLRHYGFSPFAAPNRAEGVMR